METQVASLIYFDSSITLEQAKKIMAELQKKYMVHQTITKEYDPAWGSPVWYIP